MGRASRAEAEPDFPEVKPGEVRALIIPKGARFEGWIKVAIGRKGKPLWMNLSKTEAVKLITELVRIASENTEAQKDGTPHATRVLTGSRPSGQNGR